MKTPRTWDRDFGKNLSLEYFKSQALNVIKGSLNQKCAEESGGEYCVFKGTKIKCFITHACFLIFAAFGEYFWHLIFQVLRSYFQQNKVWKYKIRRLKKVNHADMQEHSNTACIMQTEGGWWWRHLRPGWSPPPWGRRGWWWPPPRWAASWRPSLTRSAPPGACWCGPGWSAGGKTCPAAKRKIPWWQKLSQTWLENWNKKEKNTARKKKNRRNHFQLIFKSGDGDCKTNCMAKVMEKVKS